MTSWDFLAALAHTRLVLTFSEAANTNYLPMPLTTASLLLAVPLLAPPLLAQEPAEAPPSSRGEAPQGLLQDMDSEYVTINFAEDEEGLTLLKFIKICQKNTGYNFTFDPKDKGELEKQVHMFGEKQIKKEDFYSFFQIMMKINGFVCVQEGEEGLAVIRIMRISSQTLKDIKAATIYVTQEEIPKYAKMPGVHITAVLQLQYADANRLGTNLRSAISDPSSNETFVPLQTENAILVAGFGPFVAAVSRLLIVLDSAPDVEQPVLEKIVLEEASAQELAEIIQDLLEEESSPRPGGGRQARSNNESVVPGAEEQIPTHIIPYIRENALIVSASAKKLAQIKYLIAQLDSRIETPETNFHVYQLKNISAEDVEKSLSDFLQRTQQAIESAERGQGRQGGSSSGGSQTEQRIVLVAQKETNTLLITATRTRWQELERLLDRLDKRQSQVLLETALIEVSNSDTEDLGVELANYEAPGPEGQRGFGFTSFGLSTLIDSDGDGQMDTRVPGSIDPSTGMANLGTGMTAGILDGAEFGLPFLLNAAQTSSSTSILSIPSILVTNNHVAIIESKDEFPVTTATPVANVGVTESFSEYQEAGILMKITPSIAAKDYLRLEIEMVISAFTGDPGINTVVPPPRITRQVSTTVYVPDGSTVMIGGIVRDDLTEAEQGIPFLSDIPLIGWLFGTKTDSNRKTTLFFFCTPRILSDFEELDAVSVGAKRKAADVIGADRVKIVDPTFAESRPPDVLMGPNGEPAYLDRTSLQAPAYLGTPQGEVPPDTVGVSSADAQPADTPAPNDDPPAEPAPSLRVGPEGF